MEYAVCFLLINMGKTLREVCGINIFVGNLARRIQTIEMAHLPRAEWAAAIIEYS